jgi:ABC-type Fe3+/spermidine/putrescine transport system ATPase subunit
MMIKVLGFDNIKFVISDVYALADYVSILQDGTIKYTDRLESILSDQNENRFPFVSSMFNETNYLEGEVLQSNAGITTFSIGSHTIEILGDYAIGSRVGILGEPEDIILSRCNKDECTQHDKS